MTENKTTENENSVIDFLNSIENENKKNDCIVIDEIIENITGDKAKMWKCGVINVGDIHRRIW